MSDRDLAPGTVLLGKYRIDEVLGTGGMGRVIRASHLYLQQSVAIKVLLPQMAESDSTVARFLREAQAAVRLKSEHTARVIDVGTMPDDGRPYMIMEYLEGNDLNQILRHHGPQQPSIVCDLMLQACEGLAEAHAIGIVHRDIKPSNFFITRRPDGSMLLKILDFGISKAPINYDDNLTQTHAVIGTPSYMAPEQMKSGRDADARSDIWSLGVVMYQLLQGRPPFAADSYAELAIKVAQEPPTPLHVPLPPGFGSAILRCLEKYPNQRHQNVGELARMLAPYASDPATAAHTAMRATRILQSRAAQPNTDRGALPGQQTLPVGAGGGLATPIPLSPAQLTPRSWPPSGSSLDARGQIGRSQLTQRRSSGKGWMIAGAMSLTILAASAGYIASTIMTDDVSSSSPTAATSPAPSPVAKPVPTPTPSTATTAPVVRPTVPPTPPTPPTPTVAPTTAITAMPEPPSATETTSMIETKPTSRSKTRKSKRAKTTQSVKATTSSSKPMPTAKASSTSSKSVSPKPTTKPEPKKSPDLFNSRH